MDGRLWCGIVVAAFACAEASAEEVIVKNDSFAGQLSVLPCPCFVQGEEAASWLTSPCNGTLVGVQIYWDSFFGGTQTNVGGEIIIYQEGEYPVPGDVIATIAVPSFDAGSMNEFRFLDSRSGAPNLKEGQRFAVSFLFDQDNLGILDPSIAFDSDGPVPSSNAVFTPGIGWYDPAPQGVSGDWVIRAIVACTDQVIGACCLPSGVCVDVGSPAECDVAGGVYIGDTPCSLVTCPQPNGACCLPASQCESLSESGCADAGGVWQGSGVTCQEGCVGCVADITGDGATGLADFDALARNFGLESGATFEQGDIDGDGAINLSDFKLMANDFGCAPES
jgi:hypothetical protein